MINGVTVKPSRMVKINEHIDIKFPPIIRNFEVIGLIEKRVSATLAKSNVRETTPQEEFQKILMAKNNYIQRDRGTGRPTKKERRLIDKLKDKEL